MIEVLKYDERDSIKDNNYKLIEKINKNNHYMFTSLITVELNNIKFDVYTRNSNPLKTYYNFSTSATIVKDIVNSMKRTLGCIEVKNTFIQLISGKEEVVVDEVGIICNEIQDFFGSHNNITLGISENELLDKELQMYCFFEIEK